MPTPLGHSLTGMALYTLLRKEERGMSTLALALAAANAPDLDFITLTREGIKLTGDYHHGVSHSLGFALGVAAVMTLWLYLRKRSDWRHRGGIILAAYVSHLLLDLFSYDGYDLNGLGLPLLWPLSDAYYMIPLLPPVDRTNPFTSASFMALGVEVTLCGAGWLGAWWWRRRKDRQPTQ